MAPSLPCKTSSSCCPSLFSSIFVLSFILSFLHSPGLTSSSGNETDRLALLAIKAQITHDPLGITTSWNDSVHFCKWAGVTCGRLHQRVTNLNLMSSGLVGSLSPYIGNLTFLSGINLEVNSFHGNIPPEIGGLFRLRHLNLSNNSFSGQIPANFSWRSSLVLLRLGFNSLTGNIPFQLGSLPKLEKIHLHFNNLTGPIPDSFGNLSSIKTFSLAVNNLEGSIPETLGRLKNLIFLGLGLNQLSGMVPPLIFNISSLVSLSLAFNQFYGTFPSDLGYNLPNLHVFNIGHNGFTGPLPLSLSNASNLVEFDITRSKFTGKVSIDFGGLSNLWWLGFASTPLGKCKADDLSFLNSLSRCRNLKMLDLSACQFGGVLPDSIGNLSTNLLTLRLGSNQLTGSIPSKILNLVNLTELQLQSNKLTGIIPSDFGKLQMLRLLNLSENELFGHIPSSISNISQLYALHLEKNCLTGNIPSSLGTLRHLQELDLSQNHLSGSIPPKLMTLSSLTISLNLAQNQLSGSLPLEVGSLKNLGYLDVSENRLSGEIPITLGSCVTLERLRMEGNLIKGSIPSTFSSLRGLQDLDLSRNSLSGQIPDYFQHIALWKLNLSFNHFEGEVPMEGVFKNLTAVSLFGNNNLCGGIRELKLAVCPVNKSKKRRTSHTLKLMIPLLSVLLVLVTCLLIISHLRKKKRDPSMSSSSMKGNILKVSYESLLKATGGFSSENLVGSGGFGSVYRGILESVETVVAVKVFNVRDRGALKSFMVECEALRNIRHRNLTKILTACSSIDFQGNEFKALVYEFMSNGSLESWLHPRSETMETNDNLRMLGLLQRLNIAIDVATAVDYLHHHCHKPVVHCDLKPSNILLDDDMTAHLTDFGLARFNPKSTSTCHLNQNSSAGLIGTVGYAAPEYGIGSKVSPYGDVYSYGIVLLEMFTGKRPTDSMFEDGLNLHNYVQLALPERVGEILDPIILPNAGGAEAMNSSDNNAMWEIKIDQLQECLTSILRIGVACSVDLPTERVEISDVVRELQLIRDILLASEINNSSASGSFMFGGSSSRSVTGNWQNVLQ